MSLWSSVSLCTISNSKAWSKLQGLAEINSSMPCFCALSASTPVNHARRGERGEEGWWRKEEEVSKTAFRKITSSFKKRSVSSLTILQQLKDFQLSHCQLAAKVKQSSIGPSNMELGDAQVQLINPHSNWMDMHGLIWVQFL